MRNMWHKQARVLLGILILFTIVSMWMIIHRLPPSNSWNLILNITVHQTPGSISQQKFSPPKIFRSTFRKIPIPSVILPPQGGLGNQLFLFAASYTLARKLNTTLFIQVPYEALNRKKYVDRSYALDIFNLNSAHIKYLPQKFFIPLNSTAQINDMTVLTHQLQDDKILLIDCCFQSELFFELYVQEILLQLDLMNIQTSKIVELLHQIESSESVAVHIRRGDFLDFNLAIPLNFQTRAMELLKNLVKNRRLTYFIFSDDIEHIKQEFSNMTILLKGMDIIYVSRIELSSLEEFYLMTKCKHIVTPNSTFSWWAAYLMKNKNKFVVAAFPKHRQGFYQLNENRENRRIKEMLYWKHPYPKGWLTLNPFDSFADSL